jgi:hypothetical protein
MTRDEAIEIRRKRLPGQQICAPGEIDTLIDLGLLKVEPTPHRFPYPYIEIPCAGSNVIVRTSDASDALGRAGFTVFYADGTPRRPK